MHGELKSLCVLKYFSHISLSERQRRSNVYELIKDLCKKWAGLVNLGVNLEMLSADGQSQSGIVLCPGQEPLGKVNTKGDKR